MNFNYTLQGTALNTVCEYKYLGLIITSDLRWNSHIDFISRKAMNKLWALKRKLKDCSSKTKLMAYKTFVRSILEYADVVWDPYTKCNINKLERIQKKALRFIFNKYGRNTSISELYVQAGLPLLEKRRKINRLKFIFNLINGNYNLDYLDYFHFNTARFTRNKHSKSITEIKCRTDCYKYSYFPRTIHAWNALPEQIVSSNCLTLFLTLINELPEF